MLINAPTPSSPIQSQAAQWLEENGLPHRKLEHWRMTSLSRLLQQGFAVHQGSLPASARDAVAEYRANFAPKAGQFLVLFQGQICAELSDFVPNAGMNFETNSESAFPIDYARLPFAAENYSTCHAVRLAFTASQDTPLHILCLQGGSGASFMRLEIDLAPEIQVTVVESHVSLDAQVPEQGYSAYSNGLVEITVGDRARLSHYKWQNLDIHHAHIAASVAQIGQSAHLDAFVLNIGGGLVRQDTEVAIVGSEAQAIINGAYIGAERQHIDNTSQIKHLVPDSYSREVYKGVLSDQAQGVFQARILVDQIAQRTDAYQMNRALLLSSQSEVRSKPELEIYADDVKCSHGATVGQLDADQLFYLMARGISRIQAQTLLIEAYLEDVFVDMVDRDFAVKFAAIAREKLHRIAKDL